ncbi:uncharacterized protein [Diadema antillarum]|uniref:uncharacterized protein n=1 Tax=Diadema antillarum TaxID=105358 RepID=UPI003A8A5D66
MGKPAFLVVVCLAIACNIGSSTGRLQWRMKPSEIIALQGNLVMLNCFVDGRNTTSPGEHKFWWYRPDRNIIVSKNLLITAHDPGSDRYSLLLDKYRGVYSLVIRNVSQNDGGLYQCLLKQSRNGPQEYSETASLTVLTPPSQGYTPCTVYKASNIILSPSGNRALQCPDVANTFWSDSTHSAPPNETVYHSWTEDKHVLHAFFLQNKTSLLSESNGADTAYCAVNSSMLQTSPNRCRLIPRPTSTTAAIFPPLIDIPSGATLNFTCSHHDSAKAIDYSWDLPTDLNVGGIKFMKNGEIVVLENMQGDWGHMLNIVCRVTTEWGLKANATATVAFLHKKISTTTEDTTTTIMQTTTEVYGPVLPDETQKPRGVSAVSPPNPALKNISILIGPALGVIILFLLAVIFALCVTKHQTSSKQKIKLSPQIAPSMEHHKAVTLRSSNKPSTNRNSRASRRFSDSFTYRFSRDCEYENIEAYMAKKGQFLGGTSSFQDDSNPPLEANVRVKIEMPSTLSTSMPALNASRITPHSDMDNPSHIFNGQIYKPLANGNPYATQEQLGYPSYVHHEIKETEHYQQPVTHHAVIDKAKKAMKPPHPPPRKPSY